jgi:arylsulfatase A-like enzyme
LICEEKAIEAVRQPAACEAGGVVVRRFRLVLLCSFFSLSLALGACDAPTSEPEKRLAPLEPPNVLVLAPDTVRGDHLSVNGYSRKTSPNLERLAAEGINFTNASTVAPRTWQSFASILTGRYPPHHGVRFIYDGPIKAEVPIIGSYLSQFGYESAVFDGGSFIKEMTGGRGFDHFFFPRQDKEVPPDRLIFERAADWIFGEHKKPWFAFVRFSGGHWPYRDASFIPEDQDCSEHDHSFNVGTYGIRRSEQGGEGVDLIDPDAFRRLIWTPDENERKRGHRIAHYDSELHFSDRLMGELLDRLRAEGMLDNTLVVVTSDHGESLGEHGYLQHGPRVDESVMNVPLVLKLHEGHEISAEGVQITSQVSNIDIFPTIVEALGLPLPEDLDGASLLALIDSRAARQPERFSYGESGRTFMGIDPERYVEGVPGKHRMLRGGRWKLVQVPGAERELRLYDLKSDPGEIHDVADQHAEIVAEMSARLREIDSVAATAAAERELTPEQLENLRRLGYVQ